MVAHGARLLLILTSRDAQSAEQLATASTLSPAETLRQLQRLIDQGFVIVGDDAGGVAVIGSRLWAGEPTSRTRTGASSWSRMTWRSESWS